MKQRTRFEKLARGCFALRLTLAEWLELEQILLTSDQARVLFRQRARRRAFKWQLTLNSWQASSRVRAIG
ncbi:MAG TPA: hypothetical protein VFZ59_08580 [Verrucomicrobiae bacterium]|nr:hypothetical protein [Verrucomicrobiae bacterium]